MPRPVPCPAAIRYPVAPRDVPAHKAARRLHLTEAEFHAKQQALFERGFPRPDPTTGMYDLVAIDAWMDARSNLTRGPSLTRGDQHGNPTGGYGDRARQLLDGVG